MAGELKQRAYTYILSKIVKGELRPGHRLSNRLLAAEIGISAIPLREAISQLLSEGLVVEREAGSGVFVPEPSYEELLDIYDLREAVECHAIRKAGGMLDAEILDELARDIAVLTEVIEKLGQGDRAKRDLGLLERWSATDAQFHDTIVAASGNRRALETVRNIRKMSRVYGFKVGSRPLSALSRSLEEHRLIWEALRRGDSENAARLMAEHVQRGCREVLEVHHRNHRHVGRNKTFKENSADLPGVEVSN